MSLVNGATESLLGGVSQQPPLLRDPSEATEQINGWSSPAYGLIKRPPTTSVAQMVTSNAGFGLAFDHTIRRDSTTRDRVIVKNGQVRVFDAFTGTERTVVGGTDSYLSTSSPIKDIRAVTIGDTTFLVNRGTKVRRTITRSAALLNQALVFVRQVDYSTLYRIVLSTVPGDQFPVGTQLDATRAGFVAPQTTDFTTAAGDTPQARALITSDSVALGLYTQLMANAILTAIYTFSLMGSTIAISRTDGATFAMAAQDGLGDLALGAIQNKTANFADLPPVAPNGYVVHILGNPESAYDDYWVSYDSVHTVAGRGVWVETVAPSVLTTLDATTMPHQLVRHRNPPFSMTDSATPNSHVTLAPLYETTVKTDSVWDVSGAVDVKNPAVLTLNSSAAFCYLPQSINKHARVWAAYDIDTRELAPGNSIMVRFQFETGVGTGAYTTLETRYYGANKRTGDLYYNNDLTVLSGTNQKFRILLDYTTAPIGWLRGIQGGSGFSFLSVHPQTISSGIPGMQYARVIGTIVSIDPNIKFPMLDYTTVSVVAPADTFASGASTPAARIAQLQAHFTLNGGLGITPLTAYSFGISYASLATSGIPTVTNSSGLGSTLVNAFVVYDPTQNIVPDYTGAVVTGFDVNGAQTLLSGVIGGNTLYGIEVYYGGGGGHAPVGTEVKYVITPGTDNFTFGVATWQARRVGDDNTNPFPSFTDRPIQDVFFHRGRFGLVADDRIVMSSTADLFNFWRQTALQVLDSDLIDVQNATQKPAFFHSAVPWEGTLVLFSDTQVFELSGEPAFTPKSVRLTAAMDVESSRNCRPLASGKRLFIPRARATDSSLTQVVELARSPIADGSGLIDTTKDLPSYMTGAPIVATGDDQAGMLFVLTDTGNLYVHSYLYSGPDKVLNSWSKWALGSGTILGMDMTGGVLSLITSQSDGIFLETIDLNTRPAYSTVHKDRTSWGTTASYTFSYTLSPIFPRRRGIDYRPHPDVSGKLQLRLLLLNHVGSASYTVTISQPHRNDRVTTFSAASALDGMKRIAISGKNTDVTIVISDSSVYPCGFVGFAWEATYHNRSQHLL